MSASDLHKAIATLWTASGLDWEFKKFWSESNRSSYTVLCDGEAAPGQPWPYCVFSQDAGTVEARMSASSGKRELHDVPWTFDVYARVITGNTKTAKELASDLVDFVTGIFGGHPTRIPQTLTLDNGSQIISQKLNDYGVRVGDDEYQWRISYSFLLDVPVRV